MLKILQAWFQQYVNRELPGIQARFQKGKGTRNQISTFVGSWKMQGISRKTSASLIMLKLLTVWITINWNIFKEFLYSLRCGYTIPLTCLLRNLYSGQETVVRIGHGKAEWFKIGEGVRRLYNVTSAYSTYMQSTSKETLGWMKHKPKSRLLGEISITSYDMQMTPHLR